MSSEDHAEDNYEAQSPNWKQDEEESGGQPEITKNQRLQDSEVENMSRVEDVHSSEVDADEIREESR